MSEATLVIGLGNPLMGDDGLGLAALERLSSQWALPSGVKLIDGGTWGLNLLPLIEAADQVLFLDAVDAGRQPGAPVELAGDQLPGRLGLKLSSHQIELREVLALARLRDTLPSTMVCLGLQPASIELRHGLSPVIQERLDGLVRAVVARLESWGHRPAPAAPTHA